MVTLDRKDLAKYPFLKESQAYIGKITGSLDVLLESPMGRLAVREAVLLLERALSFSGKEVPKKEELPSESEAVTIMIAVYPISRILVSCAQDRALIDRLVRYQAWLFFTRLQDEDPEIKKFIRKSIGLSETGTSIPVTEYIPIASRMPEERWRLINRVVERGSVQVNPEESDEIIRERLRYVMSRYLPIKVPQQICETLAPAVERIHVQWKNRILEEFGTVEESAFPPCIRAILAAIAGHGSLTHMARFSITAFLHNIGMENTRIIELYGNVPNFDLRRTMYQVEHISGRGGSGSEYTSPLCATMRTHGLCVRPDSTCESITHPLSYYKIKKRQIKQDKKGKPKPSEAESKSAADETEKVGEKSGFDVPDNISAGGDNDHKEQ